MQESGLKEIPERDDIKAQTKEELKSRISDLHSQLEEIQSQIEKYKEDDKDIDAQEADYVLLKGIDKVFVKFKLKYFQTMVLMDGGITVHPDIIIFLNHIKYKTSDI